MGEPPEQSHPVVWFATGMQAVERRAYGDTRTRGAVHAGIGVGVAVLVASGVRAVLGAAGSLALGVGVATAGKMLADEAHAVGAALAVDDVELARRRVATLVGRSTDELDESGVARAAVESVAENTVDAVTATLFWGAVGGLHGVLVHRAINTMDAMIGHRDERYGNYGWAAAKLDDAANWIPARLTAAAVGLAAPARVGHVLRTVRVDAHQHPSPNGGVIEAAFAGALDVRLGGSNTYRGVVEDRGELGDGAAPNALDIGRATALAGRATLVLLCTHALAMCVATRLAMGRSTP